MRIAYVCRHCQHQVGELDQPGWSMQDANRFCGIESLSQVERDEHVTYNRDTGTMFVQVVCDHCQRALETHPELLVEGKLLQ